MNLAILGAGSVGGTLGKAWARKGHTVIFGVREPGSDRVRMLLEEIGSQARAQSLAEAVTQADVVALAVTWTAMPDVVAAVGDLEGKILLDGTNPLMGNRLDASAPVASSGGEQVAAWFPRAKVVKVFNQVGWETMADPSYGDGAATMFHAGDDAAAKQVAARLAADIGFEPIDAGALSASRHLENLALFWGQLAYTQGMGRHLAWRLLQR
jgi:predicted dinucleotide-binding enzyme